MPTSKSLIPIERIEKSILLIRSHKVMLDSDLAELYGVHHRKLEPSCTSEQEPIPQGFHVPAERWGNKIFAIANCQSKGAGWSSDTTLRLHRAGRSHALQCSPERERAVQVNVQIMRAFVRMRQLLASHKGLMEKILTMEKKYDKQFKAVFQAIYQLMKEEEKPKLQIGFTTKDDK